jgi:hypothetical protein
MASLRVFRRVKGGKEDGGRFERVQQDGATSKEKAKNSQSASKKGI